MSLFFKGIIMLNDLAIQGSVAHDVYLSNIHDAQVQGGYVYVVNFADPGYLTVIDISDPSNPVIVGQVTHADLKNSYNLALKGSVAFVSAYETAASTVGRIVAIDISSPTAPSYIGVLSHADHYESAHGIVISDNVAFLAAQGRLNSIDITDPAAMSELQSLDGTVSMHDIFLLGNYIYVAGGNKCTIIDVSDPSGMAVEGEVEDAVQLGDVRGITVSGDYAYLTGYNSKRFTVVDVSDPANPVVVGSITNDWLDGSHDVHLISSRRAVVASRLASRVNIINISDPTNPILESSICDTINLALAHDGDVLDRYFFITCTNRLTIVDTYGAKDVAARTSDMLGDIQTKVASIDGRLPTSPAEAETIDTADYNPSIEDTGDLEAATKTIVATSKQATADYSAALTIVAPTDDRIVIAMIAARLEVTRDSGTSGNLYCSVYVDDDDGSEADHCLFDSVDVQAANLQATNVTSGTLFDLLSDGAAHTYYFFFWVDAGDSVISLVELWSGVCMQNDANTFKYFLKIDHRGLISFQIKLKRIGSGAIAPIAVQWPYWARAYPQSLGVASGDHLTLDCVLAYDIVLGATITVPTDIVGISYLLAAVFRTIG